MCDLAQKWTKIKACFYLVYVLNFVNNDKDLHFSTWILSSNQSQYKNTKYSLAVHIFLKKKPIL